LITADITMQNTTMNPLIPKNQKPRPIKLSTVMALNDEDRVIVGPTTIETAGENEMPTNSTALNTQSDLANNMKVIDNTKMTRDFENISDAWKRMTPQMQDSSWTRYPRAAVSAVGQGASYVGQGIGQGASYVGQGIGQGANYLGSYLYPTNQSAETNAQPDELNNQPNELNNQPAPLNDQSEASSAQPDALNAKPAALNAKPAALNVQPAALNVQPVEVIPESPVQNGGKSRKQMKRKSNKRAHKNKRVTRKQRAAKKQTVSTKKI